MPLDGVRRLRQGEQVAGRPQLHRAGHAEEDRHPQDRTRVDRPRGDPARKSARRASASVLSGSSSRTCTAATALAGAGTVPANSPTVRTSCPTRVRLMPHRAATAAWACSPAPSPSR